MIFFRVIGIFIGPSQMPADSVKDVGPTLYKCYKNILCVLGLGEHIIH